MNQKPRIFLDLKRDLPRKFLFCFNGVMLILREPSVQQVEEVLALGGIDYYLAVEFLKFVDWTPENLQDILDFCMALPIGLLNTLVNACKTTFERPDKIDLTILENCVPTGAGYVREVTTNASAYFTKQRHQKVADYLLERLGVIVKPAPKRKSEETERPSEGWLPLTAAMDPRAYNNLRKSLQYDPEEFEDEILKEFQEKIKEFGKVEEISPDGKKERMSHTLSGDPGISLMYKVDKLQFATLFHKMNRGFYRAKKDDGIDLNSYMKSAQVGIDPQLLKERKEQLIKEPLPTVNPAEVETISIKGRWRGSKKELS